MSQDQSLLALRSSLLRYSYLAITYEDLDKQIKQVEENIKQIKEKESYSLLNNDILTSIKFELDQLIKNKQTMHKRELIRYRDRFFGSWFRNIHIINEKKRVTKIFNEFIKGITYFGEEVYDPEQPFYHRHTACSKKGSDNTICNISNTGKIKQQKKDRIRLCYIERLVYDNIWSSLIHSSQDKGHIEWLDNTRQAYETCFPDSRIYIEVEYTDHNIPYKLKIFEGYTEMFSQEAYEKRYDIENHTYIYPVYCTKEDMNTGKSYEKQMMASIGSLKIEWSEI